MKSTIQIQCQKRLPRDHPDGQARYGPVVTRKIEADVYGALAVHRDTSGGDWKVTHIASGFAAWPFYYRSPLETKREAETVARTFDALFDWATITAETAQEWVAPHRETMQQVRVALYLAIRDTTTAKRAADLILGGLSR